MNAHPERSLRYFVLALLGVSATACSIGRAPTADDAGVGQSQDAGADAGAFVPAPHRTIPPLQAQPGMTMSPLTLVTITATGDAFGPQLNDFGDALIQSQWWHSVSQPYALAMPAASLHVTGPTITTPMAEADLVQYVQNVIANGGPAPNGSTLYLLYLPETSSFSDTTFGGYHGAFPNEDSSAGDSFAFVQHQAVSFPVTQLDALTITASHEILEASTDPDHNGWYVGPAPSQPWIASVWESLQPGHIEVGDLCEHTRYVEPYGSSVYAYQRIFSNPLALSGNDDACLPLVTEPYFSVSTEQDWYLSHPGDAVSIPFTGWSSAERGNWLVNPHFEQSSSGFASFTNGGFAVTTTLGAGNAAPCTPFPGMGNGVDGTLTLTVPTQAVPGDWIVLRIASFVEGAGTDNCYTPLTEDSGHEWLVGVYVQ
jgi:hypothetical protein